MRYLVVSLSALFGVSGALAQAPVVSTTGFEQRLARVEQQLESQRNAQLLQQLVTLEEQLRDLQGQLEQQQNTIRRLEKRQRDVYLELDQLRNQQQSSVSTPTPVPPAETLPTPVITQQPDTDAPAPVSVDQALAEQGAYDDIYALIRAKQYPQAIEALGQFLQTYPEGKYAANAYYWLGQLYSINQNFTDAETALMQVVDNFPNHHKRPDALVKLGILYAQQAQLDKARQFLQQVLDTYPDSTAARLAQTGLQQLKAQP